MNKILLLLTIIACASSLALADPACPIAPANIGLYESVSFTCNDLTFSNLTYTPSGSHLINSNAVTISFVDVGGEEGLQFNAPWIAIAGATTDSTFNFDVTCNNGCSIDDLELTMGGAAAKGANGDVNVSENATPPSGPTQTLETDVNANFSQTSDKVTFAPVGSFSITKDLAVTGPDSGPSSGVSQIQNLFSTTTTVPEPSTLFACLVGLGLIGLAPVARRKFGL